MRIATWNINGLRARLEFTKRWLRERKPDLVGLQELKLVDELFPHADFEALGYRAVTHGQKAWNGVAILARRDAEWGDIEVTQLGLPNQSDFGARLLSARAGKLSFTTVYCPNGKHLEHEDYARKLAWFDDLTSHFAKCHDPQGTTLLCGDLNIVPAGVDDWNGDASDGRIFRTDEERARFGRLLDWGFHDLFRELHPEAREFTWWDYRGGAFHRGHGLRIDFLLGSAPLLSRVTSVEIDRGWRKKKEGLTASDHAPVVVELDCHPEVR